MTDTAADRDTHEPAPSSDADAANRLAAAHASTSALVTRSASAVAVGSSVVARSRITGRPRARACSSGAHRVNGVGTAVASGRT